MHPKSGQIAMEYLMVVALVSIVIIPTTFLFYNYASESAEQIDRAQIDKFGRELTAAAETVYYLGYPSRIVLEEKLPANVESVSIVQDPVTGTYFLLMDVRTRNGVSNFSYPAEVNLAGVFGENDTRAGIKKIRIESTPPIGGKSLVTLNLGENATCNDDTFHEACSAEKPKYCYNSVLIDNCQQCGCPVIILELQCKPDGSCAVPRITGISPSSGPVGGGTTVAIAGSDFIDAPSVTFGGVAASVTFVSSSELSVVSPAGSVGTADVVVTNADGGSYTAASAFTYNPPPTITSLSPTSGPAGGGTSVTIAGSNFLATPAVTFGGVAASVTFVSSAELTSVTPLSFVLGPVDVRVTNADGGSATLGGGFNYISTPTITNLNPGTGPSIGGTTVSVTGSDFIDAPSVTFGGVAASVTFVSSSELSVVSPAGSVGTADVVVTNADGGSYTEPNAFTYLGPTVFVTSSTYNGDLQQYVIDNIDPGFLGGFAGSGLYAGNLICQERANAASLGGSWIAWLSDTSLSARDQIPNQKYVRADFAVVADNLADLTDGTLANPINLNENGVAVSNSWVWTGTLSTGFTEGFGHCSNWDTSYKYSRGVTGLTGSTDSSWTNLTSGIIVGKPCSSKYRLYCFKSTP